MQSGPQALVGETHDFFVEIEKYIQSQLKLLESNAQADSRYVSAFVERVAKVNVESTLKKLNTYLENPTSINANSDRILKKLLNHVHRMVEFLEKHNQIVQHGNFYVPIPYHRAQAPKTKAITIKVRLY